MGNVIPWSQIHPSIKSEQPFVGVVFVDPRGKLCISELIHRDSETDSGPDVAGEVVALAQQAAAAVATAYRAQRKPARPFRVLKGGTA